VNDQTVTTSDADVVDRLARLRAVVPLMAADLATARRRAIALEIENRRLTRRVMELESRLAGARRTDTHSRVAASGVRVASPR
jgi:hypothetical protein